MNIEIIESSSCNKIVQIFKNLSKFADFTKFQFTSDRIYSQGMDSTKSAIFELSILKEWFDIYNVSSNTTLSLNTLILSKIFSIYTDNQKICIEYIDGEDNINISFVGADMYIRKFTLPLTDIDFENITVKKMDYDFEFSIQSKTLFSMVEQLKIFDDKLTVICNETSIIFASSGDDGDMQCIVYDTDENIDNVEEYLCTEEASFDSSFGIKLFSIMCSFDKVSADVHLSFNNDTPMYVKYVLGDGSELSFHLAPKISE